MNDMLNVLKELRDEQRQMITLHRHGPAELRIGDTERSTALDQAIAIITEVDTLLPVLQQMAHSVALGDTGDGALKRLIGLLYSRSCPMCGSTEPHHFTTTCDKEQEGLLPIGRMNMPEGAWFDDGKRVRITSTHRGVDPSQSGTRGKFGTICGGLSCMGWVSVKVDGHEGVIEYALDQIEPTEDDSHA